MPSRTLAKMTATIYEKEVSVKESVGIVNQYHNCVSDILCRRIPFHRISVSKPPPEFVIVL